jgi:hypothetical protein
VGPTTILNEIYGPYLEALEEDFNAGFLKLMEKDNYSTREYIRTIPYVIISTPGPVLNLT